nr:response regulator [Rhodopirellula sp. JC740]
MIDVARKNVSPIRILIVDDDRCGRMGLLRSLEVTYEQVESACDVAEALRLLNAHAFDLVITDIHMLGPSDGFELLDYVHEQFPATVTMAVTADDRAEVRRKILESGAISVVTKPLDLRSLRLQVRHAVQFVELKREHQRMQGLRESRHDANALLDTSPSMRAVRDRLETLSRFQTGVLLETARGSESTVFAKYLHQQSGAAGEFITFDFTNELEGCSWKAIENECGQQAANRSLALLKATCRGARHSNTTMFFANVTSLPVDALRRWLSELADFKKQFAHSEPTGLGHHVVFSGEIGFAEFAQRDKLTSEALDDMGTVRLRIPSLNEIPTEIPLLVDHYLKECCNRFERPRKHFSKSALQKLIATDWEDDLRQLKALMERIVVTVQSDEVSEEETSRSLQLSKLQPGNPKQTLQEVAESAEKIAIREALSASSYHREHTAKALGISVRTLHYKMNRYDLH